MIEQNNECYVSLEVAKLLKEAGFNTYEEAQEEGIKKAIEIILKKGE